MSFLKNIIKRKKHKSQGTKIINTIVLVLFTIYGFYVLNARIVENHGRVLVEGKDAVLFGICMLTLSFSCFLSIFFNYLRRFERWKKSLLPQIFKSISILAGIIIVAIVLLKGKF